MNGKVWITMGIAATLLASSGIVPSAAPAAGKDRVAARRTLTASISGPTSMNYQQECSWTAVPSGGTPPYVYGWLLPNSSANTQTASWDANGLTGNYAIGLFVTDATNQTVYTEIGLYVATVGWHC